MKKFKFRLQRVLDFRESEKEELLRELAKRNLRVQELKDHLSFLEDAERRNGMAEGQVVDVEVVHLLGNFAVGVQDAILKTRLAIIEAEEAAAEALQIYLEKLKEVKSLYALKDKRLVEYKDLELKEEIKMLDEVATRRGNTFYTEESI